MNILITCQFFNYCSGSAMYVHDLAIELKRRGNTVTILSELGGEISNSALKAGIKLVDFSQVFSIQDEHFDVLHLNQSGPAEMAIEFWPDTPATMTLHSSLGIEAPYIHPNIKKYIAAKQTEVEKFKALNPQLIHIGVDFERYNTKGAAKVAADREQLGIADKKSIVFIGSYDRLREKALTDLIAKGKEQGFTVVFVGRPMLGHQPPQGVMLVQETFFIEKWMEASDGVASILLGRTAIETWACGKDYWCYDVNEKGDILGLTVMPPPEDMSQYDIKFMTDRIFEIYQNIIQ